MNQILDAHAHIRTITTALMSLVENVAGLKCRDIGQYFENFKAVNRSIPDSDRLYCDTNP